MQTRYRLSYGLALSGLIGLALVGLVSATPAFANDDGSAWDDQAQTDPMPLSYPFAAPGSLHMYHWKDYTGKDLASGSAMDQKNDDLHRVIRAHREKEARERRENALRADDDLSENWDIDPMPLSYPFAAPGSLHMYHWKDYTGKDLASGSALDQKTDDMHAKMKKSRMDQEKQNQ